jgi:flagellum-specific peptidoglycan hydrolase FlgJ
MDIVMAQAKLETGNFQSDLVRTHQNIFGMKKGKSYRKYSHWTECVADYKVKISSRYTGGDYYEFLERIGYAENPNYSKLLRQLV